MGFYRPPRPKPAQRPPAPAPKPPTILDALARHSDRIVEDAEREHRLPTPLEERQLQALEVLRIRAQRTDDIRRRQRAYRLAPILRALAPKGRRR